MRMRKLLVAGILLSVPTLGATDFLTEGVDAARTGDIPALNKRLFALGYGAIWK